MMTFRTALLLLFLFFLVTPSHAQPPQYETDQVSVTQALNEFWALQGLGQTTGGIKPNWGALLGSSDWYEWNSLKVNWSGDLADKAAQRELLLHANITGVNAPGAQAKGYVWPSNGSEFWLCPNPHFDQMPRFVCAVYNDYLWSRDVHFLQTMHPKLDAVMGYLAETMQGRSGLLHCPGVYNGLPNRGPNTTYMDCYREGGKVTWIEEGYYTALGDMAAMETILGHPAEAKKYAALARSFPAQFQAQLWNPTTRRFVGWKDMQGSLHDYGFTYLNLEALARGLSTASEAYDIFDWLDHGKAQPTQMGGHRGSADIYQCVVAPRSNTVPLTDADWDFWSVSKNLRESSMGYGALVEDGGALLWVNYYDVMARLKWLDADSAWQKFAQMLYRVEGDPLRFTESASHPTNIYGENYLEVGPADGPENGLNGTAPLYGFMGIQPRENGLSASPNLPTSVLSLASRHLTYGPSVYDVRVSRGQIVAETVGPQFTVTTAFNKVGFRLSAADHLPFPVTVTLQKRHGDLWAVMASSPVTIRYLNFYAYAAVPSQSAGTYRLVLTPPTGSIDCRAVMEPITPTAVGILRRGKTGFTAKRAFSRIAVQSARPAFGPVTLWRQYGRRWREVETFWTVGNRGGVLGFADQPAGIYQLQGNSMGRYQLLSGQYRVSVTKGSSVKTRIVPAGQAVRLD